jgi:hypothetical protein
MLINCTNHRYEIWGEKQREVSRNLYGEVYELPFPAIDPTAGNDIIRKTVDEYFDRIKSLNPTAVLVAGEFSFTFMLTDKLLKEGYKVVTTCSRRETVEVKNENGSEKKSVFLFERFREYEYY